MTIKKGLYLTTKPSNNLQSIKTYYLMKRLRNNVAIIRCKDTSEYLDVQIFVQKKFFNSSIKSNFL